MEELKTKYGVTKLDLVIANAAIMEESVVTARIDSVAPEAFEKHWRVNVGSTDLICSCSTWLHDGKQMNR